MQENTDLKEKIAQKDKEIEDQKLNFQKSIDSHNQQIKNKNEEIEKLRVSHAKKLEEMTLNFEQ